MKRKSIIMTTLLLCALSLGLSSCYFGYYQPGPRYRHGGGPYFKGHHHGGHHHHGHHGGHHRGGGGYRR